MKIFLDSANIEDIKDALDLGVIEGITTNPTLIAKSGETPQKILSAICMLTNIDVSAEVFAEEYKDMIEEGRKLFSIGPNIVLKLPLTKNGLKACRFFSEKGFKTNITLCFSAAQALLAAKAGATYISPFIGRLEDVGENGMGLIKDIREIYINDHSITTQILAASVRSKDHVIESAKIGANAATISFKLLNELYHHNLTDKGLEIFRNDISKAGLSL
ncbi:MAG: fructose-6-phosphate aldolase [Alphaproteobacteria bacterium]|nr:fructose-6-phosphate aldolase [Alphaproteobacteria bacterium]